MATDFPAQTITDMIASYTGLPCFFEPAPQGWVGPRVNGGKPGKVTVTMVSRVALGWDDERETYDPTAHTLTIESCGQRQVTLSLRVDGLDQTRAWDILEAFRMKLNKKGTGVTLRAVGLAWSDIGDIIPIPGSKVDTRATSAAAVDWTLNQVVSIDATEDPNAFIDTVTSTTNPADGLIFTKVP